MVDADPGFGFGISGHDSIAMMSPDPRVPLVAHVHVHINIHIHIDDNNKAVGRLVVYPEG